MTAAAEPQPRDGEPVGALRHPLRPRQVYSREPDGSVLVKMGTRWGRFTREGRWLEGPVFEADPELCLWVSAARPTAHHRTSRILDAASER